MYNLRKLKFWDYVIYAGLQNSRKLKFWDDG